MPDDDPAYTKPLPAIEFLDAAARASGFADWFAVPATFRTPTNRRIIVNARVAERVAKMASEREAKEAARARAGQQP